MYGPVITGWNHQTWFREVLKKHGLNTDIINEKCHNDKNFQNSPQFFMEQWINLFFKVSKPVLTTIVYTGINNWLEVFQEEITEVHKQHTKNAIKSLTFQDTTSSEEIKETPLLYSSLVTTEQQGLYRSENGEEKVWPLRLSSQQLLQKVANDGHNLLFFLATPKKIFPEFSSLNLNPSDCDQRLCQNLREFLQKNYSFSVGNKGISFIGGLWNANHFYGETSFQLLFERLRSISCVSIDIDIQGSNIKFNLIYWRKNAQKYHYTNIFTINYHSLLRELVTTRVKQWQNTRNQLLQLGKSQESITRLGGICEKNYQLFEELEDLKIAGIKAEELNVNYKVDQQDYDTLCEFLSIFCCLLGGCVTVIHYLINYNLTPHLPVWLLSLGEAFPKFQSQVNLLDITIKFYEDILTILGHESPHDVPELALKLAESLMNWPDKNWAIEPLIYSFTCWRQQHPELSTLSPESVPLVRHSLSQRDQDYLHHLQQCLSGIDEPEKTQQIHEFINCLTQMSNNVICSQPEFNHFHLQETITTSSEKILCLKIDEQNHKIISQRESNSLKIWNYNRQQSLLSLRQDLGKYPGQLSAVTLSKDGEFLASSEITKQRSYIKIWQLSTGEIYQTLFGHRQPIKALAIHIDEDSFIASGSHKIKLWNLLTGESLLTLFGHKNAVSCLGISPDGQRLISGSVDASLRIWHLKEGNLIKTLTGHQGTITTLIISEDGKIIISGSADKTIKLWNIKTGKLLMTLRGHLGSLQTFYLYSSHLFAGDETGKIYVWDLKTGNLLYSWNAHQHGIKAIAMSQDGERLISGCQGGKVKLWFNQ